MPTAIYPGTFDPITRGHIDIVQRASYIFTEVITIVADNPAKDRFFTTEERLELAQDALAGISNVRVIPFQGLIVDVLRETGARTIIRGLRALSDFEGEFQMAFTNRKLYEQADTVFLMPSAEYAYLSSSLVKQIAHFHGDVDKFVTPAVARAMRQKREG
ncbi:pantetheine-phosphate adenylyltransferase [Chitinivibrio alkaliphilus]|uniref:Phosphopantetheine adenylyltransferase n=1 Tax=Chitinivibrio alkaliphilus ACht1 TaxID=1313304 RepID=U7D6P3_9BACT|nr:pantetheine-phosphate adenylyltransferase [Chitinivibrio alkaliphilus]ERP31608.1 pantetheine-phosphate adenylyltransferase [Chitinivibrio alkaliphilus ACht1]